MKLRLKHIVRLVFLILPLFAASCGGGADAPAPVEDVAAPEDTPATVAEEAPSPTPEPEPAPEEPSLPALPAEAQAIEIVMDDGRILEASYYPAAVNPAPIVVLMHWAGGDIHDWDEIAPWLQNRADEMAGLRRLRSSGALQGADPWLDPSWFPTMPADANFGVLTFNFGDFGNSPPGNIPESWADEAYAAVKTASELEGVDPEMIAAIGASIGADGAVDGCHLFNESGMSGRCIGALSLSPGNYLTQRFSYAEAVTALDEAEIPVWCLTAQDDIESIVTCETASGDYYLPILYPGSNHGMRLVQPDYLPTAPDLGVDTLVILQDFLEEVFGLELN